MAYLYVSLFGAFQTRLNDTPIASFGSTKAQSLLAYLAIEADRPHSRTSLAALLWPEDDPQYANKSLRQALYVLRQIIRDAEQDPPFLLISRQTVQFNLASDSSVDVVEFLSHLKERSFAQALALYRGDLLEGFDSESSNFDDWLSIKREHLHQLALAGLHQLGEEALVQSNPGDAIDAARRQLAMEPWHEAAHRQLMRALVANGDRAGALAQYEQCQQILRKELGMPPSPKTVDLYQTMRDGHFDTQSPVTTGLIQKPQTLRPVRRFAGVPEISNFYGREEEQALLRRWVVEKDSRLVGILGIGGLGKTTLAIQFVRTQLAEDFDVVLWHPLLNAPPLDGVLADIMNTLTGDSGDAQTRSLDQRLPSLLEQLRRQRCLIVLDNMESILAEPGDAQQAGAFRSGYEDYDQLLNAVARHDHRSCLLFTSRERPRGVARLEADFPEVRSLMLGGMDEAAGRALLDERGLTPPEEAGSELMARYSGNPLALKLVAEIVREYFGGDLTAFLAEETLIFEDVRRLLDEQFARLTSLEREVMVWLTVQRTPMTVHALRSKYVETKPLRFLLEAVRGLERRSLVEQSGGDFYLQNVITEYVTNYLIDTVCTEIASGRPALLTTHGLLDTGAAAYVRQSQMRVLHRPILERLTAQMGEIDLVQNLLSLVEHLRALPQSAQGYGPGNLLNLLILLQADLRAQDFSQLSVWHVDLNEAFLPQADFSGADLTHSLFIHTFHSIISLDYSPDGALLAAGTFGGHIHLWRTEDWQPVATITEHTNWVFALEFSPDGKLLASGSHDGTIHLWDVVTFSLHTKLVNPDGAVIGLSFHPKNQLLITVDETGMARLWRTDNGEVIETFPTWKEYISTPVWHPNGEILLFAAENGEAAVVWDVARRQPIGLLEPYQPGLLDGLAVSPNGTLIAGRGPGDALNLWDFPSRRLLHRFTGHTDHIPRIRFGRDGKWIVTTSIDRTIRVWDIAERRPRHSLSVHQGPILGLAVHPSLNQFATGANDHTLAIWDADSGHLLRLFQGYAGLVACVVFSPDGREAATGSFSGQVNIWDMETGKIRLSLPRAHDHGVYSLAFSPDGRILASSNAAGENEIRLWHARSGREIRTLKSSNGHVLGIAFSSDGAIIAGATSDGGVRLWDVASGMLLQTMMGHIGFPYSVVFSPDGKLLASTAADDTVRLWDTQTGDPVKVVRGHESWGRCVTFHPTRPILVSCSDDRTIRLWSVPDGEPIAVFKGHEAQVRSLAILPDGERLISGSYDGTLRLWNMASGETIRVYRGHTDLVMSVAVSADGRRAVSGGFDETVRIWDIESGECLRVLRNERPYEGMNIAGATGLTPTQIASLKELGAVENF